MTGVGRRIRAAIPWSQDAKAIYELIKHHKPRLLTCVCCGHSNRFRLAGSPPRLNAMCPNCGSLERHRQLVLLLQQHPELVERRSVLHFAPEPTLRPIIEKLAGHYKGADIEPMRGDVKLNIEAIDLPDGSVETIICNHVMEHVDDRKALSEMRRVLTPGGIALLTTPIVEGWPVTYEDPSITSEADRLVHFGQSDHVRYYGRDLRDRIRAAGFDLREFVAVEPDVGTHGFMPGETIFIATKQ